MKSDFVIVLAALLLIVSACHRSPSQQPADALASLQSNPADQRYGIEFWKAQQQSSNDLWQHALEFCGQPDHQALPNCGPVLTLSEDPSSKRWLGRGTNIPFGLQQTPAGNSTP